MIPYSNKMFSNSKFQDIQEIEDMPMVINWDFSYNMSFGYEIETEIVRSIIPRGAHIEPYEIRPGISLMFLNYHAYNPGNEIYGVKQESFIEVARLFLVQPKLSVSLPTPRFTFYVHGIGSNNEAFIKQEIELLHMPCYYSSNMTSEANEDKSKVVISDDYGKIQEFNVTEPNPTYIDDAFFGQYYSVQDGKVYHGFWYWAGKLCVHQKKGFGGNIYDHPFLTKMDKHFLPSDVGECYIQMFTAPGEPILERSFQPKLIREI